MKTSPPDSMSPSIAGRLISIIIILLLLAGAALAIYLFAMALAPSSRGYEGLFYLFGSILAGGSVIWSFITWLVYRSMRASGRRRAVGAALLFLFFPLILLVYTTIFDWLEQLFRGGY
ncbi:hypothetical protein [Pseudomonas sp.]|uniref:hypothetical protein n=1 Tax=Pseudomonas sp. TaxID=306 RepID=UPI00290CA3BA|nr:hypothetical protein [Pseudomonas sp.]MDU4253182.1 hypothetical protein [Pseudomonas sp.]